MFKKYISLFLLIFFSLTLTGQALAVSPTRLNETQTQLEVGDQRIKILEGYLNKYNSPLAPEAKNFVEAADKYNIDWKFVAAIAGNESTFGKFTPAPASHNAWGWGVYGTQAIYFKTWKEGIYTVSEGLREHYYNKGLTNTYAIARVYAASPVWAAHVTYFLADMAKFEKTYIENQVKTTPPDISSPTSGTSAALRSKS
ncbi:MAG: hypothetical protein PHQ59_04120 [Candidatus Daviesbacteria bacterium]|nr:hypothetical protein [Candidatus Daviesbacteria bacterium]